MSQSPAAATRPPTPDRPVRLNQPWRGIVAVVELLLAAGLALAAVWSWRQGIVTIEYPPYQHGQGPQVVTRYFGNWIAGAITLVGVAGFAVVDAVRQTVLALRSRGPGRHGSVD